MCDPTVRESVVDAAPGALVVDDDGFEPITEILQRLHDTGATGASLTEAERRRCVAFLTDEGYSIPEIAGLVRVGERTVSRLRAALRESYAIEPDLARTDQLLGEYQHHVRVCIQRLRRLAADATSPPYARLWALDTSARIFERFLDKVHAFGYCIDGKGRLRYQQATDPAARQRERDLTRIAYEELRHRTESAAAPPPPPSPPVPSAPSAKPPAVPPPARAKAEADRRARADVLIEFLNNTQSLDTPDAYRDYCRQHPDQFAFIEQLQREQSRPKPHPRE